MTPSPRSRLTLLGAHRGTHWEPPFAQADWAPPLYRALTSCEPLLSLPCSTQPLTASLVLRMPGIPRFEPGGLPSPAPPLRVQAPPAFPCFPDAYNAIHTYPNTPTKYRSAIAPRRRACAAPPHRARASPLCLRSLYVLSAGFFSRSAIRRGLSEVVLNRPRPSSPVRTFFFTICEYYRGSTCGHDVKY